MKRRILITGGFGYVGGRVAQVFSALPDTHVLLGSRKHRMPPDWLPTASVAVTCWDDPKLLRKACAGVDTILHFAAMNEIEAARDPVGALQMNGVATVQLLVVSQSERVRRFIYLSTAHVYGAPLAGRIDEAISARPTHPYATSHRAAEDVVLAARDAGVLDGLVIRLSNSFGAPSYPEVNRWTLLVNDLCLQAVTNRKLVLRSAGLQRRDFITLSDVARAIVHLDSKHQDRLGDGVFNVGGAWAPTVLEMATLVANRCEVILGFRPEIKRPKPEREEVSLPLDYRIDKLLGTGFKLTGDREAEIDATLEMCRLHTGKA